MKTLCAKIRASIIGSSTKAFSGRESSALGRIMCQPSICAWLDCRARLRNKSAVHYADTLSGRMIKSPAHCSRPKISPQMSASRLVCRERRVLENRRCLRRFGGLIVVIVLKTLSMSALPIGKSPRPTTGRTSQDQGFTAVLIPATFWQL